MPLRKKMILLFLLFSFLPLTFMSVYSYVSTSRSVRARTAQEIAGTLAQIAANVELRLDIIDKYSRDIVLSLTAGKYVQNEDFDRTQYATVEKWEQIDEVVAPLLHDETMLKCICIAKDGRFVYTYGGGGLDEAHFFQSNIDEQTMALNGLLYRGVYTDGSAGPPQRLVLFGRAIREADVNAGAPYAALFLFMREEVFLNTYATAGADTNDMLFITDQNGEVVSSRGSEKAASLAGEPFYQQLAALSASAGSLSATWRGEAGYVFYHTLPGWNYRIIRFVPERQMNAPSRSILYTTLACYVILFAVMLLVSALLSRVITKPVARIQNAMLALQHGDFGVEIERTGEDEFGSIAKSFNFMAQRLRSLVDDLVAEEHLRGKAQYQALQYRINPHFLYNTLASIRMSSLLHDDSETAEMIQVLARLLKRVLGSDGRAITLEREMMNLKDYAFIQKLHYDDRFEIVYQISPDAFHCEIPGMILQPLVENALFHGLCEDRPLKVAVRAEKEQDRLTLCVTDDGKGMDAARLEEVRALLCGAELTEHIGVANVAKRLRLAFPGAARMDITSEPDGGTAVTIQIFYSGSEGL